MAIGGPIRVACRGTQLGGELWANIWHIKNIDGSIGPGDAAVANSIANLFRNFYNTTAINAQRHNGWTLEEIFVTFIGLSGDPTFDGEIGTVTGASTATPAPYEVAMCLSLVTALNTKRGRGRIYLNGWANNDITAEALDGAPSIPTALRTLVTGAVSALELALNALVDPKELAVFSRMDDTARGLTRVRCGSRHDTQRRRGASLVETFVNQNL